MKKLVLFGTGIGASTAFRYFTADSKYEPVAFTVDSRFLNIKEFLGLPVVPFEEVAGLYPPTDFEMAILLGYQEMNELRAEKFRAAKEMGYTCASYVHSSNQFLEPLRIGENCFILGGQSIDLDVAIGDNVVMWSQNHIGDRTSIGDHTWIPSDVSLSGDVIIEEFSFLGINCTVCNNVTVKAKSFVGAGALISKDTVPHGVYLAPQATKGALLSDRFMRMSGL